MVDLFCNSRIPEEVKEYILNYYPDRTTRSEKEKLLLVYYNAFLPTVKSIVNDELEVVNLFVDIYNLYTKYNEKYRNKCSSYFFNPLVVLP